VKLGHMQDERRKTKVTGIIKDNASESYIWNNDMITLRAEEVLGRFYDTCFHLKLYHESVFVG
jgi:hypothetical protein